ADVLRMSVHSAVDPLPDAMPIVQISERDWELGKNYPAEIAIKANVKETLRALLHVVRSLRSPERAAQSARKLKELASQNWTAKRERLSKEVEGTAAATPIDPRYLMMRICETLPVNAVVV